MHYGKAIRIHFGFCRGEKGFDDGSQRAIEHPEGRQSVSVYVRNVCIMTCFDDSKNLLLLTQRTPAGLA